MTDSGVIAVLAVSICLNFLIMPLFLWLGWDGVKYKLWRLKLRNSKYEAQLYFTKSNSIAMMMVKKEEGRIRIKDGSYVSTPHPDKLYRFMGMSVRLRRENVPEDFDVWDRPLYDYGWTAKELDNAMNEIQDAGIAAWLRKYGLFIMIIVGAAILLGFVGLALNYKVYDAVKVIAPKIMELFPGGLG